LQAGEGAGRRLNFSERLSPLIWYPRLHDASPADRAVWEWIGSGGGIHWPHLDEDLSIKGMLEGNPSFEYGRQTAHAAP
jgi:hypothetical protein